MTWYRLLSAFCKPLAGFLNHCKGLGYHHYLSFGATIPATNDGTYMAFIIGRSNKRKYSTVRYGS
ncbi:MAG: hypothetical protein LBD53_06405 [Tannerella sp.]|jgi:hypothetical protein|nr:hypothetical protein [Tannerella sp.]